MLLPKDSLFPETAPRWEIGGKIFKACMYWLDPVTYPGAVFVAFMVKRGEGVWETLYKSDYWTDIQAEIGAAKASEWLIPHFNEAVRKELGLPDLTFDQAMNEYLTGSTKVVGNMLVFVK